MTRTAESNKRPQTPIIAPSSLSKDSEDPLEPADSEPTRPLDHPVRKDSLWSTDSPIDKPLNNNFRISFQTIAKSSVRDFSPTDLKFVDMYCQSEELIKSQLDKKIKYGG